MSKVTPGGLPYHSVVTSYTRNFALKRWPQKPSRSSFGMTPFAVFLASEFDEAFYVHLLLSLLQREEVEWINSVYAVGFQTGMRCLEDSWRDLCDDIENGTLNTKVKNAHVREAVVPLLRKDEKLSQLVRQQFSGGTVQDGLVRKLWPNAKVIDTVCSGSMMAYVPAIAKYSGNLPIICSGMYSASEGTFGINMDPLAPPEKVRYTFLPDAAYYEFIEVVDGNENVNPLSAEILDLLEVQAGHEYEILVTTLSGLYRNKMGDILKVVGYYNSTPSFEFLGRAGAVLSVNTEKTHESELNSAVDHAMKVVDKKLGRRIFDYTSVADSSTNPGHYVVFWELHPSLSASREESLPNAVLEECCELMEANLSSYYREKRNAKLIGPLELRIVSEGTFTHLAKDATSRGASPAQYKTPRGINPQLTRGLLDILNQNVFQKRFAVNQPQV